MKKIYQQPKTTSIEVCPQSILCGSYTKPDLPYDGSHSGFGGG
jgi:hypothetical protein